MNADPWWLTLPSCPRCGKSHVLTDCAERLPFELGPEPFSFASLTGEESR